MKEDEKALSVAGQKVTPENKNYTARIRKLSGIASLMVKSSRMFMDQLEREFDLEATVLVLVSLSLSLSLDTGTNTGFGI